MTRPILVTCLCIVALAGCTRTVRETVVERPVVHETVVEKPVLRETVVERPTIATAPMACSYGGIAYSNGALSCQSSYQYRCNNGTWDKVPGSYC